MKLELLGVTLVTIGTLAPANLISLIVYQIGHGAQSCQDSR